MLKLDEIPFNSKFGVINVGDDVVVITEGYCHSIKMARGKYLGINENGNIRAAVEDCKSIWVKKGTDIKVDWRHPADDRELKKIFFTRTTTLFANRIIPLRKS